MVFIFYIIKCLCERTLVLNVDDQRNLDNLKVDYDKSIEKGKGQGKFEDFNINLENEAEVNKFVTVSSFPDVPEGLVDYIKVLETLVSDPIESLKRGEMPFVIYFVDEKTVLLPSEHAESMAMVFVSSNKKLAEELNTPYPGIFGFNPSDKVSYQFPLTPEFTKSIIPIISTELISPWTYQNLEMLKATGLQSYYVFIKSADIPDFATSFKPEASKVKHLGKFCLIPFNGNKEQLTVFGFTEEDLPGLLFINDGEKFPLKKCTENSVEGFIKDVLDKKIEPLYVSQDEPSNNEELNVKVITRNNLEKYKADKNKDKLIVFSSPKCSFCIQLKPVLEELGAIAKSNFNDKLIIGSCDITINDISGFDISSVPKIYLIKGESNDVFLFESKDRSPKAIAEFIKDKGSYNLDLTTFLAPEEIKVEKTDDKASEVAKESRDL